MKAGVGLSKKINSKFAIAEAIEVAKEKLEGEPIDWGILFFSWHHSAKVNELLEIAASHFDIHNLVGCSSVGVFSLHEEIIAKSALGIILISSPNYASRSFLKRQHSSHSASVTQQLREELINFQSEHCTTLLLPDAYHHLPYNYLNLFQYLKFPVDVFGGGSCDDGSQEQTVQLGCGETANDGIAGICLGFPNSQVRYGITNSCVPVGEPMFVTQTNSNTIVKLDDYSALEVLATVASHFDFEDLETAIHHLVIGFPLDRETPSFVGGDCVIRSLEGIEVPTQGIVVPHAVEEGDVISFMYRSPTSSEQALIAMLEQIITEGAGVPTFGIYFNCAARGYNLYGEKNVDIELIQQYLGTFPLLGMFGGFEIASVSNGVQLYLDTGVLVLFYDER